MGTLAEKQRREAEKEALIQSVLNERNPILEAAKRDKKQKKRTTEELAALLDIVDIQDKALRPVEKYVPKSYNKDKQVSGLVNHLFVKYPVPQFMYRCCIKEKVQEAGRFGWYGGRWQAAPQAGRNEQFKFMYDLYREWFLVIAQGGSFTKKVKGFMTSKEATLFLRAPNDNHIHENVWWAKMKMLGFPLSLISKLLDKIYTHHFFDDPDGRLMEVMHFYANYHKEMDKQALEEITDFVAWKLRNDRGFRFKGRTVTSMTNLSNEWHTLMVKAKLGSNVEWPAYAIQDWEMVMRDHIWQAHQLLTNKDLMNEGRKQKHCVYSYVSQCANGSKAIFSLRYFTKKQFGADEEGEPIWQTVNEAGRITCEVTSDFKVIQIRGALNASPSDYEKVMIRQWAGDRGLMIATWGRW